MPTEAVPEPVDAEVEPHEADSFLSDEALTERTLNRRTARLGVGVTIVFLIALYVDWTLAYLAPAFVAPMLLARAPMPLSSAVRVFAVTMLIMLAFYFVAGFARIFPVFFLMALVPALFWTFRYSLRGGSSLIVLLILIGLMLVPMVAKISSQAAWDVAASSGWNIGLSLVVAFAMFALFPALPSEPGAVAKPAVPDAEVQRRAWILTVVTGSYSLAYFAFDWTNVHTPIYIAIFVQQMSLARGLAVSKGILGANIAGGLIGWFMYELFVMAPNLAFVAMLSLTVFLIFARMISSGSPKAPLVSGALNVLVFVLGSAMVSFGDDETAKITDRLGEIGIAAIYAVAALYVLEAYFPGKHQSSDNSEQLN